MFHFIVVPASTVNIEKRHGELIAAHAATIRNLAGTDKYHHGTLAVIDRFFHAFHQAGSVPVSIRATGERFLHVTSNCRMADCRKESGKKVLAEVGRRYDMFF
jgi:hypothetical protein